MSRIGYSSRLLAAATAGVAMAPAGSVADVVRVSGQPVHVASGFSVPPMYVGWDVDGDGTDDGIVFADGARIGFGFSGSNLAFFDKSSRYPNPPFQLTMPVFGSSDMIGPTVANNFYAGHGRIGYLLARTPPSGTVFSTQLFGDLAFGQNVIGFGLNIDGDRHFGFAEIELTALGAGGGSPGIDLKIHRWAYEDEPNTAIHVEAIPALPSGVAALTLLGLGAAGLRRLRQPKPQ